MGFRSIKHTPQKSGYNSKISLMNTEKVKAFSHKKIKSSSLGYIPIIANNSHTRNISINTSTITNHNNTRHSYNSTTLSNCSKHAYKNIGNDIEKMFNSSIKIEANIKKAKETNNVYYNKYLVKGYEKASDNSDSSLEKEQKDVVPELPTIVNGNEANNSFSEKKVRKSILKDPHEENKETINSENGGEHSKPVKKTKTLSSVNTRSIKFTTLDLVQPRSPEAKRKKLTQRLSTLQRHLDALKTLSQLDIYEKIDKNRQKIENLTHAQRKVELQLSPDIKNPGEQIKLFKELYNNEMNHYVKHKRQTNKDQYDYITKLDKGDIIKDELKEEILLPGTLIKETSRYISLQPRFIKRKFKKHFNLAELHEGNMLDIIFKTKTLL
jgi:hypothetical protein